MVGNGAYSDRVYYGQVRPARLRSGDVGVATDTGPRGRRPSSFGAGHPERIADWGHRAVHESVGRCQGRSRAAFYGAGPAACSYFSGCSTGGHQALSEAERYPTDFDGIHRGRSWQTTARNLNLTFLWALPEEPSEGRQRHRRSCPMTSFRMVRHGPVIAACDGLGWREGRASSTIRRPVQVRCRHPGLQGALTKRSWPHGPRKSEAMKAMYSAPRRTGEPASRFYASFLPGSEGSEHTARDAHPGWSGYWSNPRKPDEPQRGRVSSVCGPSTTPKWDWWSFDWGQGHRHRARPRLSPMV